MDGTSNTILISENEDAGRWIWCVRDVVFPVPAASTHSQWNVGTVKPVDDDLGCVERYVAFCYPSVLSLLQDGEIPVYIPLGEESDDNGGHHQPLFINEGRLNSSVNVTQGPRTTRPSSGHPGGVVAAFCDGGTWFLRDDMDKTIFVRLARPGSGVILNPKDIFD